MSGHQQRQEDQQGQCDDPSSPDILTIFEDEEDDLRDYELPGFRILEGLILIPNISNRVEYQAHMPSQQTSDQSNVSQLPTNFTTHNGYYSNWQRETAENEISSDIRTGQLLETPQVLETYPLNAMPSEINQPETLYQELQTANTVRLNETTNGENLQGSQTQCHRTSHSSECTSSENTHISQSLAQITSLLKHDDNLNFHHKKEENNPEQSLDVEMAKSSSHQSVTIEECSAINTKCTSSENTSLSKSLSQSRSLSEHNDNFEQSVNVELAKPSSNQSATTEDYSALNNEKNPNVQPRGTHIDSITSVILNETESTTLQPTTDVLDMGRFSSSLTTTTMKEISETVLHISPNLTMTNTADKKEMSSEHQKVHQYFSQNWSATDAASMPKPSSSNTSEMKDLASENENDMLNYNMQTRPATDATAVNTLPTPIVSVINEISENQEDDLDFSYQTLVHPRKKARTTRDPSESSSPSDSKM